MDKSRIYRAGLRSDVDIVVAAAESADVHEILDLWRRAEAEPSVTDDEDGLHALIAHDPQALLVARAGDEIVATVIAAWNGWRGSLYRLAVAPEHRRRGLGRAIVAEAEQRLRARGARRIDAVVVGSQADLMSFWTAVGYEAQDERVRFVKNLS